MICIVRMRILFISCISGIFLSGCTPVIENRGYDLEIVDPSKVRIGQTKDEVLSILGSPSTLSTFKDNAWYYVSKKVATKSFFKPDTLEQNVIIIQFSNDVVTKIENLDKKHAVEVELSKNKTETMGYDTGILREVFGNFGRFSSNAPTKS